MSHDLANVLLWIGQVLMALAIVFHTSRPGEGASIVLNLILGVIAILVAYGRFVVASEAAVGRPPAIVMKGSP